MGTRSLSRRERSIWRVARHARIKRSHMMTAVCSAYSSIWRRHPSRGQRSVMRAPMSLRAAVSGSPRAETMLAGGARFDRIRELSFALLDSMAARHVK